MDEKVYAVLISKEASESISFFAGKFLRKDENGSYFYAKRIDADELNYFHMWFEDKNPDGKVFEFEARIPHRFVCAVFHVTDVADLKSIGFTGAAR